MAVAWPWHPQGVGPGRILMLDFGYYKLISGMKTACERDRSSRAPSHTGDTMARRRPYLTFAVPMSSGERSWTRVASAWALTENQERQVSKYMAGNFQSVNTQIL